jgi:hypothetical protein
MHNIKTTVGIRLGLAFSLALLGVTPTLAQTLNRVNNLSFGIIDYDSSPATGNVTLGTNGTINYSGNLNGTGYGTPGLIEITGTASQVVDIRCVNSAILSDGNGRTVTISPFKVSVTSGQTYSNATTCIDIYTTVASHTLAGNTTTDRIYIGGQLQTTGVGMVNAGFDTQKTGGMTGQLQVVYQ